jgi:hypothetical protein
MKIFREDQGPGRRSNCKAHLGKIQIGVGSWLRGEGARERNRGRQPPRE